MKVIPARPGIKLWGYYNFILLFIIQSKCLWQAYSTQMIKVKLVELNSQRKNSPFIQWDCSYSQVPSACNGQVKPKLW